MQDLIKEIVEQSTGYKVLPDEIVSGSPVYQIIKEYCDGIIKRECEHAGYVQSADPNRRFCGAKRTRCGASGLTSIIEI